VKTLAREMVSRTRTVTGVGLAQLNGAYAVKVNLLDGEAAGLPRQIEGVPVIYERTGRVRAR